MKDKIALGHRGALRCRGAAGRAGAALPGGRAGPGEPLQSLVALHSSLPWCGHHGQASTVELEVSEVGS